MGSRVALWGLVALVCSCSGPENDSARDPCAAGCDPNARCITSSSGRRCVCGEGYEGDGTTCRDADGCSASRCFPGVTCVDVRAPRTGFTCGPCPSGYSGDGMTCTKMVDCASDPALCSPKASCLDVAGQKRCVCGAGYAGDGATCTDIDGCVGAPCFPGVACTDVPAPGTGHACGPCPSGTSGDGAACADIDGCAVSPCFPGVACTDLPAPGVGRVCGPCPAGYSGDGATCVALVDCSSGPGVCDSRAACKDVGGGALRCVCNEGWVGSGATCADLDECAAGAGTCAANARCVNAEGSYSCACEDGTVGDGTLCSALATSCSQCDSTQRATCTWVSAASKYACVCKPGFVGTGLGAGSCVASGLSLAFEPASMPGYVGQCLPMQLTKKQGTSPAAFSGETLLVSSPYSSDRFFSDAGCLTSVTSVRAPRAGTTATVWVKGSEVGTRTVTVTHQVLGTATGSLRLGSGPATRVAFKDTAADGTTTGCMKGWVTLLDASDAPAVETRAVTVTLTGIGGVAFSLSSSTCQGAAAAVELTVGELTSSPVAFYFKGTSGAPGTVTLRAEDKAALLQPATQDVALSVPTVAGIRFNPTSYWAKEKPGACHSLSLEVVDAAGGLVATPTSLTVSLASDDGKMTVYGGTNCYSSAVGQVAVPAGASSLSVRYSISAYGSHQLTATSSAGTASFPAYIGDPCASGCIPSGSPSICGCNGCCSGACFNYNCY